MKGLLAFRSSFDPVLERLVQVHVAQFSAMAGDPVLALIAQHGGQGMLAGGKRIRPYLASLGYRCFQDSIPAAALRSMTSLEFFHCFALIQDDVMDQGKSRHGFPTVHVAVADALRRDGRTGDADRIGQSQAVLLSDVFLNASYRLLESEQEALGEENTTEARRRFSVMADEVILGQMIDVDLTTRETASWELIERKMRLKTSSYTFTRPLEIGAALAGGRDLGAFTPFADALGLAFQIQDDLFDLTIPSAQLGKSAFSDLRERQHTVFTQFIREQGTAEQKRTLAELFGSAVSEADRSRVTHLFETSGAIADGRSRMETWFARAEQALKVLPAPPTVKNDLADLVAYVRQRTS